MGKVFCLPKGVVDNGTALGRGIQTCMLDRGQEIGAYAKFKRVGPACVVVRVRVDISLRDSTFPFVKECSFSERVFSSDSSEHFVALVSKDGRQSTEGGTGGCARRRK